MHRILEEIDQWKDLSPERVEIKMSDAIDRLKFDRMKRYESDVELDAGRGADAIVDALRGAGSGATPTASG
jgi:hypothetical protein